MKRIMRMFRTILMTAFVLGSLMTPGTALATFGLVFIRSTAGCVSIVGGAHASYQPIMDLANFEDYEIGALATNSISSADSRWQIGEDEDGEVVAESDSRVLFVDASSTEPLVRTAKPLADNRLPPGVGIAEGGCSIAMRARFAVSEELTPNSKK